MFSNGSVRLYLEWFLKDVTLLNGSVFVCMLSNLHTVQLHHSPQLGLLFVNTYNNVGLLKCLLTICLRIREYL